MAKKVINPWLSISPTKRVLCCDLSILTKISYSRTCIEEMIPGTNAFPEPWNGDLVNADIYILNMNPSSGGIAVSSPKLLSSLYSSIYKGIYDLTSTDIEFLKGKGTPVQQKWWKKFLDPTKMPSSFVGKKICVIEYFPYHTTTGFKFPLSLPSNYFVDNFINQAIVDKKLIIIARQAQSWFNRIPDLRNYKNTLYLNCLVHQ